ncbi:hypothetical protein PR202_gb01040 [Eleusine coracana subsp. coracana]|uniref:Uncharacterized protein n=1 Tax=Eleusine coracana subsp. coracana TaxID=191504 RepID=A0AAV5DUX8_ELECO|nr:hypothetical protein QOZ80_5BG0422630 [Eleusine coracana subsp. coracana]GJN14242.1 hypothetical protein PR202_gb01040 [Eleusine coracana subsp. coracana]
MLASICRRRRLLLALRQIPAGGEGSAASRIHPNASTVRLSHVYSLTDVAPNPKPCPTTVSYLVSCGVSPAAAAVRKVRIRDTDKADAVCALLREYGFSEAEVTRTVGNDPMLLTFDPDRILRPKLDFIIHSLGFPPRMIAAEPHILARSLDKHLVPCIDFLRGILGTEDKLRLAVSRIPRALMADVDNCMRPVVEGFRRHGLPEESISKLLFIHLGVVLMPLNRIAEAFEDLKELGMCSKETNFLYAFRVMCSLKKETWRRKVALYQSFGVSEDVLIRAFKTQPTMLLASEEAIKKKVRFFQDTLKLDLSRVIQQPMVLSVSLENCVKPRCAVLSILIRKGRLERKPNLIPSLVTNAKIFAERFVLKHADDVPDVVKAFEGKIKFEGFTEQELNFLNL